MAIKKTVGKDGRSYHFSRVGKRISEGEYNRRRKIARTQAKKKRDTSGRFLRKDWSASYAKIGKDRKLHYFTAKGRPTKRADAKRSIARSKQGRVRRVIADIGLSEVEHFHASDNLLSTARGGDMHIILADFEVVDWDLYLGEPSEDNIRTYTVGMYTAPFDAKAINMRIEDMVTPGGVFTGRVWRNPKPLGSLN